MGNIKIDGKDCIIGVVGNVNPDIEWEEGAACFAGSSQWFASCKDNNLKSKCGSYGGSLDECISSYNYQLNTIKQGDYIEASELDTEQEYNDVVEVFELFGFNPYERKAKDALRLVNEIFFASDDLLFIGASEGYAEAERKLTYQQLMAIGELKRLEIERDKKEARECFVEALDETVAHAEKLEGAWTDKHYDFNYQLTKEDIEKGHVRVDAYFVNRMWKINQWDDTGAAFHVLKTLPRIANNKNPLKRELVALKKQVDLLCKMHGVDDEK